MNKYVRLFFRIVQIFCNFQRVRNNRVFFDSLGGQYNDNPRYISEKLHRKYPDLEVYWEISDKRSNMNEIPEYVHRLKKYTFKYYLKKSTCKVQVDNGVGYLCATTDKLNIFLHKKQKNKKQYQISTWHGNPIKHIGAQAPGNEFFTPQTLSTHSDLLIAGCSFVKKIFEKAFLGLVPIELTGTPRTDILFSLDEKKKLAIKTKLGLPIKRRIVLFAPTYRDTPEDSGVEQMKLINFEKLFETLHSKFGGDWCFIFRVHNMVLEDINTNSEIKALSATGDIFNGNKFDDMNDYLAASDVLISDFSGCVYEVALTDIPCFLFAHDRKKYEEKERGLYAPISIFPYLFADTFDELISNIKSYNSLEMKERRLKFLDEIGNMEDGLASERLVKIIIEKLSDK